MFGNMFSRAFLRASHQRDDELPVGNLFDMIVWGIIFASIPVVMAITGLLDGHAPWPFDSRISSGHSSIAVCIAFVALGAFAHFHYFWGILKARQAFIYGRKLSMLCIVLAVAYVLVSGVHKLVIAFS